MPRAPRILEEGRIYHVYNRVAGGSSEFEDAALASRFVALLRDVARRDDLTVLAWCLLGNHYHLVVRQGAVPLSTALKSLQQGVTRTRNFRSQIDGPLWRGRFQAKQVDDQQYLMQVVAYVHLNPVKAKIVESADDYPWSGHGEILGRQKPPIVAVDEVLLLYGDSRRKAMRSYRAALGSALKSEWSDQCVGSLPWWKAGHPAEEETLILRKAAFVDPQGRTTTRWRPRYGAEEWLEKACAHLRVDWRRLADRGRDPETVELRELIGLVGIERYGVGVSELAAVLGKSRDGVSKWYRRGAQRRMGDPEFAGAAEALDEMMSEEP